MRSYNKAFGCQFNVKTYPKRLKCYFTKKGQSIEFIADNLELTIEQVDTTIREWEAKS